MAVYGYARASTLDQDVAIQEETLRQAGCEVIYKGRKPSIDRAEVRRLRTEEKLGPAAIAQWFGIGREGVIIVLFII